MLIAPPPGQRNSFAERDNTLEESGGEDELVIDEELSSRDSAPMRVS